MAYPSTPHWDQPVTPQSPLADIAGSVFAAATYPAASERYPEVLPSQEAEVHSVPQLVAAAAVIDGFAAEDSLHQG